MTDSHRWHGLVGHLTSATINTKLEYAQQQHTLTNQQLSHLLVSLVPSLAHFQAC